MSVPPAPPLLLASTSPQRRAILKQLGVPFDEIAPRYEEHDPPEADAARLVHATRSARLARWPRRRAIGLCSASTRRSCSTAASTRSRRTRAMRSACSRSSPARTHAVVSGLALVTPGWEHVEDAATLVTFRPLTPRDLAWYIGFGEWEGRAGGYAIQGRGAALVEPHRRRLPERGRATDRSPRPPARRDVPRRLRFRLTSSREADPRARSDSFSPGKVGVRRFELRTSPTRTERATRLRYTPTSGLGYRRSDVAVGDGRAGVLDVVHSGHPGAPIAAGGLTNRDYPQRHARPDPCCVRPDDEPAGQGREPRAGRGARREGGIHRRGRRRAAGEVEPDRIGGRLPRGRRATRRR